MEIIFGIMGLLIISFAIWLRNEKRQDILFIIGGTLLFFYSISIKNVIFIILQIVFVTSALIELLRIRQSRNKD